MGLPRWTSKTLAVYYNKFRALADINLSVHEKRITAIIGPSGCGKSTLLRSFNRMNDLTPSAASRAKSALDGDDIYAPGVDVVDIRRRVGMVFQRPNPFPKSIYDNVAYGPRLYGIHRKADLDEIVEKSIQQAALVG
jgi:phosphate transport system ATP-binding protein